MQASAVMEFQSQQACTAAAVVRRGSTPCCAAGYADGCLRLFDLSTAALAWSAHHHSSGTAVFAVHPSPDGRELLTIARFERWPITLDQLFQAGCGDATYTNMEKGCQ